MAIYVAIAGLALICGWLGSPAWPTGVLAAGLAVSLVSLLVLLARVVASLRRILATM